MRKIYILLMHTNTFPSKIIQKATHYKYSHVVISLEENCTILYSFGRKTLNNILNCGFTMEKKQGAFFQKFNQTTCRIYELEITEEQYQKVKETLKYMEEHKENYKYDFLGLFLRFWNISLNKKDHYVCSHFVAWILEESDIYHFKKKVTLIRPKDFEELKNSQIIYEGLYQKYQKKENKLCISAG